MTRCAGAILLTVLVLVASGCKPAPQLDWKVQADDGAEFDLWRDRRATKLAPTLRAELDHALGILNSSAGVGARAASAAKMQRQFLHRINQKTVREVLVDSYHFEREFLLQRTILQADNIVRNVEANAVSDGPSTTAAKADHFRARQEFMIQRLKERLALIEGRLEELQVRSSDR